MATEVLKVEKREKKTKSYLKELRKIGKVPGVYYMQGEKSVSISIDLHGFRQMLIHRVNLFDLDFGKGKKKTSIIRDMQYNPITGEVTHVDLLGVKASEKIVIKVPLNLVNTPVGIKEEGGILEFVSRELEIACLPKDIPTSIDVDIAELHLNDSIVARDISLENMDLVSDEDMVIALISPQRVEEEVVAEVEEGEEGVEGEEPEVISDKEASEKEE
jgi:large subunit ribosomal protein L25